VGREQQPARDQKGEHTVDGGGIEHHGQAQVFGVGDDPLFVLINGGLELFEGKHTLPEGLDHRNASDVLHGLIGHSLQCVAVLPHFFNHPLAGHGRHNEESQHHRRKAQQTQPPVKRQQQNQQPHRGSDGVVLVWQLVGQIGLGGSGALMDDLAQLTTAKSFGKAQRQHRQMLRHRQPQIGRHPERRQVGAHQRCNVNKVRQHCKQHCHPAVMGDVHRLRVVRRGVQHIPQDHPDIEERDQRHQCADGGKHPGGIGKNPIPARIAHQAGKVRSFFQSNHILTVILPCVPPDMIGCACAVYFASDKFSVTKSSMTFSIVA
jgi:hypothetical protein